MDASFTSSVEPRSTTCCGCTHFPKSRTYPAFKSNICVPIAEVPLSGGTSSKPLGALCFDSDNTTSFNSLAVQDALKQLGQYIASVLLIYQKLRERYSS